MYLYIELWNARPTWQALHHSEREAYLAQVGPGIQTLTDAGIELLGFALNDADTPYRADYRYLALWRMPDEERVQLLENMLEEVEWHHYFEQVNAQGQLMPPQEAVADMLVFDQIPQPE